MLEIWTYNDYAAIEEKLRKLGFVNNQFSRFISRYTIQDITVDIMPTGENVIGFANKWYPEGYKKALEYKIEESYTIKILSAPYLLQQNSKHLKTAGKMMGARVPILRILFLYWKIGLPFGKK